jgi:anti-sigma factor RsiW
MDWEAQLKLQAFLDGELPEVEAREMADKLAREPEAAALLAELRQTHALLVGFENDIRLPESREFFWSKVERGIGRSETTVPARATIPWISRLRHFLMPATAMALLVIAGFVATRQNGSSVLPGGGEIETALADPGAFTYHDYPSGTTLVWLSYPAENELADDEEAVTVD